MKTDDLIAVLARGEAKPAGPSPRVRLLLTLGAGLLLAALLLVVFLGVRPDIGVAIWTVLAKAGFSALAAAAVLPLASRLMRPGRPIGWRIGAVIVFFALCLLAAAVALLGEDPDRRLQAWVGGGFPWCLLFIPLLASPAAVLLVWLARAFAPTNLSLTGAAIGALSGGVGAMAYAMYCPMDSVAFVTTWYALAIAFCAALGALIAARFLRW